MKKHLFTLPLVLILASWHCFLSFGQTGKFFSVSGDLGFSTEFYNFSATDSALRPRRPDFNYRLFFNPVFHFGKKFSLPVSLVATKRFSNAYLPLPSYDNPLRSLTNPNNAIGLSPTFSWATFHMGSHTADFSELSTGNLPIFGAGIDLRPGKWRLAYSNGMANWALRPDTTLNLQGTYQRRLQAVKLGWGEEKSYFYFNATKISDLESSVKDLARKPQDAALFTFEFGLKFSKHISGKIEAGACAFTKDKNAAGIEDDRIAFMPDFLFQANETTRLDYASLFSLNIDYPKWGLSIRQKKIGAGYVPLGFGFMESDVLDRTVAPRLQLFNNKFILNGSIGLREDNLSGTKFSTTKRIIASGSVMAIFTKEFSVSANYANYGARNNLDNDTLRLEFVSRNLTVTPVYRIRGTTATHTLSATYALSDFDDKNLFTGELAANKTTTFSGNYHLGLQQFSFTASGTLMLNDRSTGALDITTLTLQPGYGFLKRKLNASLGFVYAIIAQEGYTDSKRFILRPKLRWRLTPKTALNLQGSLHTYKYGSVRNGASYDESYLQTGITQQF